ncbi:unnamed protein product [Meloidogyne enterolobii]|uniref:Uncharacterized protein n=1 Tax=Meloidogyne enterolobii TaxID=390850 RepID=A0ACB0YQP6_MELEN
MSGWIAYIKTLTDSCNVICRAAIVGLNDGGSVWARTEGDKEFKATESELKKFVGLFDNLDSVPETGADLEGFLVKFYLFPFPFLFHPRSIKKRQICL